LEGLAFTCARVDAYLAASNHCAANQPACLATRLLPDALAVGPQTGCVYTVVAATTLGFLCGFTQLLMGSPGDLPETVRAIHERGRIPVKQAPCMFICSAMSIAAGALPDLAPR